MFRTVIALLIAITGASSLQIAFFPRRPSAVLPPRDIEGMRSNQVSLLHELPGRSSRNWALSPSRRYSLRSLGDRQLSSAITLSLTTVAARSTKSLQVALNTQGNQQLEMEHRRVYLTPSGNEYALGKIGGHDALQSCIVAGGGSGVTRKTLDGLAWQQPVGLMSLTRKLHRLAGLETHKPPFCLLVTMISSNESGDDPLVTIWRQIQRTHVVVIAPSVGQPRT